MVTLSTPLGIISLPFNTHLTKSKPTTTNGQRVTVDDDHKQTLHSLLDKCSNLKQLQQIHAHMLRTGIFFEPYSASKLTAASLSPFSSLEYARKVFDEIPQPNLYTWNTLMRAYSMSPQPGESIRVFLRMLDECSESPNKFTYPFVIKAVSQLSDLRLGKAFHGMAIKANLGLDLYIMNALVYMYGSCGELDMARQVFARILVKDVVSWNSMISAYVQGECVDEALHLFKKMESESVKPNHITMIGVLSACTKKMDLELGKWFCSYVERNGISMTLPLNNAMLDMYMKCKSIEDAKALFDKMEEKDIVTWTIMLDGYAKLENYDKARRILDSMPVQDIAAWNALISAYEQNGKPKEAVELFHELQVRKSIKPDQVTLVSTLSACAQLGAMDLGGWIHVYIRKQGMELNCHLVTSLIDMYSKCGDLEKAFEVFNLAEKKDVYVRGAMIAGMAMHGRGKDAIDLFSRMQEDNVRPSAVTYTNLLCACSHSGLVEEGRYLFGQMETAYGISPGAKHYSCMVDILGRAGRLEEAVEFIEKMPIAPSTSVWGALLSACRIHADVDIAEKACSHLLQLDPTNHGAIVLLSNVYAKAGNWDAVSQLRKQMREHGIKKEPGCSSIEYNGKVHNFLVGDNSHPLAEKIYSKLDEILARLKSIGYVPDESDLLQLVEEEDMKEQALNLHSEKLAIAFGLLTHQRSTPIRVVKNLRVCKDCHSVAKLISKLYDREILLRDRYRFHHFRGGNCSCCDYW